MDDTFNLTNGKIEQWGTGTEINTRYTFPTKFTSDSSYSMAGLTSKVAYDYTCCARERTAAGFLSGGWACPFTWVAIGY